ncbi:MAG: Protein containing transglutaminase-like domain, putative cysteine protease, partial [uncultured Corynebacteriales bacterium]
ELADRGPAPDRLPVRLAGARVVQRGADDPRDLLRAAPADQPAGDPPGGPHPAVRRLLGHPGARVRRARPAHRADGHRDLGGGDGRAAAGPAGPGLGGAGRPAGHRRVQRAARPVPVRGGRGRGRRGRRRAALGRLAAGDRAGRGALGAREPRLRPRRDLGRHHLGRGPRAGQGRLPGLHAPGAGAAALGRAAGPVRLRLPAPEPGRPPRRAGVRGEPRLGGVLGRRLGAAGPLQPGRGRRAARAGRPGPGLLRRTAAGRHLLGPRRRVPGRRRPADPPAL